MDAGVDETVAGELRLVADPVPGRVGEGVAEGVFGSLLVDLPRGVEREGLPGDAAVFGDVLVDRGAAGDLHLGVDLRGGDALGQLSSRE